MRDDHLPIYSEPTLARSLLGCPAWEVIGRRVIPTERVGKHESCRRSGLGLHISKWVNVPTQR